jgi:S-adenosyl-L-methionine hydrolase (adenosine-forming)
MKKLCCWNGFLLVMLQPAEDQMIALFTDFGIAGPYTGQVKAVLAQLAPGIPVIDLFADLPPGKPKPAAYLLAAYGPWFPPGTVLLAVVDPGVGGERRAVAAAADGRFYVGPDNGLLELVLRRAGSARNWDIVWRPESLSASFHGRDLFAPVAARLALGGPDAAMLRETEITRIPDWPDDLAEIVYIDHYGNAMTGLRAALPATAQLVVGGRVLRRARTFSDAPPGAAFWYENANGLAEIAVNAGRADTTLGLAVGSPVSLLA